MTQDEFNKLPLVLKPAHMREITGLDKRGLETLRESNPDIVLSKPVGRGGGWRYKKPAVAKAVGIPYV